MRVDLFDSPVEPNNRLPYDGTVYYHESVLGTKEATKAFEALLEEIEWVHDEAIIYGKRIITKRKVGWYGEKPFSYTYSKTTKIAKAWTPTLLRIKETIESVTQTQFNACLLNLYHNGQEGMSWHSDGEKELVPEGVIASVSLGADRKFAFKHKATKEKISLLLEHGSLLTMQGKTQAHWQHSLPTTKRCAHPRINLTFRCMREPL